MAWSTPSNQATSDLMTAAIWNQNAVANPLYLYSQVEEFASADIYTSWSNSAADQTLLSVTIPAGRLGTNKAVRFMGFYEFTNSTGSNQWGKVKITYGATVIANSLALGGTGSTWYVQFFGWMKNVNSASVQHAMCVSEAVNADGVAGSPNFGEGKGAAAENSANALTFLISVSTTTANVSLSGIIGSARVWYPTN